MHKPNILLLRQVGLGYIDLVGGKNASLGELKNENYGTRREQVVDNDPEHMRAGM